jgi:hypothetical protein
MLLLDPRRTASQAQPLLERAEFIDGQPHP